MQPIRLQALACYLATSCFTLSACTAGMRWCIPVEVRWLVLGNGTITVVLVSPCAIRSVILVVCEIIVVSVCDGVAVVCRF